MRVRVRARRGWRAVLGRGAERAHAEHRVLLLDVLLELVAAVLAVGAIRTAVLGVAPAFERHVPHEVLARVVAALAVGALVAALRLVLRARQRQPLAAREDVVARLRLGGGRARAFGRVRRRLGRHLVLLPRVRGRGRGRPRRRRRHTFVLLGVVGRGRGRGRGRSRRRRLDGLEDRKRGCLHWDVLFGIFFTTRHYISRRSFATCKRKWNTVRFSVGSDKRSDV